VSDSEVFYLINKSFEASIGEPWDFQSKAGQNKLTGTILAVSDESSSVDWLLLKVSPFRYEGNEIKKVVGINRYKTSQNLFGDLLDGNTVTLNFMFPINGYELKNDNILTELADESKFSFLVGSINTIQ
jgi:hypothetical protein